MTLINHVPPLPNKPPGADGYTWTTENLIDNNAFRATQRVDCAIVI
jgi:hypothetical protein